VLTNLLMTRHCANTVYSTCYSRDGVMSFTDTHLPTAVHVLCTRLCCRNANNRRRRHRVLWSSVSPSVDRSSTQI